MRTGHFFGGLFRMSGSGGGGRLWTARVPCERDPFVWPTVGLDTLPFF